MTDIATKSTGKTQTQTSSHAFRRAVVRGLAVLCPPLLTVLIFVWAINTTKSYFLEPVTSWARDGLVLYLADVREDLPLQGPALRTAVADGQVYYRLDGGAFIPQYVYERVQKQPGEPPPTSGEGYYRRYVDLTYLRPYYTTPSFLAVFVLLLYLLGKFMAAGIGGFFGDRFDKLVNRVPGVRSVQVFGDGLHVWVSDAGTDGPALTAALREAGLAPSDPAAGEPSLEDVFFSLVTA
jgi:hypothetical protein